MNKRSRKYTSSVKQLKQELFYLRQSTCEYPNEFVYAERHKRSMFSHHRQYVDWSRRIINELKQQLHEATK